MTGTLGLAHGHSPLWPTIYESLVWKFPPKKNLRYILDLEDFQDIHYLEIKKTSYYIKQGKTIGMLSIKIIDWHTINKRAKKILFKEKHKRLT